MKRVLFSMAVAVIAMITCFSGEVASRELPVDGTCCPEAGSKCIVGNTIIQDNYFNDEGPCPKEPPVEGFN